MSLAWALAILLATSSSASPEHDGADWMAAIPNSWRLGSFSIPGTHDTFALHETVPNTARCQSMTLAEQLNAGMRYLDIRCRHMKDRFVIYHGIEYQHFSFEQVLQTVNSFLDAHPSETIILSVNEEHKPSKVTRNFWETFEWYYAQNPARWHIGEVLPELGSVRGKIVLLRRFNTAGSIRGLDAATNWSNNHPGILRVGTQFSIQDWYFLPRARLGQREVGACERSFYRSDQRSRTASTDECESHERFSHDVRFYPHGLDSACG